MTGYLMDFEVEEENEFYDLLTLYIAGGNDVEEVLVPKRRSSELASDLSTTVDGQKVDP